MAITIADLRCFAISRSLFRPTTLKCALDRMGFVQADPIRAPARAQDLILRHRVKNYRAGDLERHYEKLDVREDFFVNYGFVTREIQALMHPRYDNRFPGENRMPWPSATRKRAQLLLEFIRARGIVHPREVDKHFSHGTVRNYWGGKSNATTHLLDLMHYQGLLRVVRRQAGIRLYAACEHAPGSTADAGVGTRLDALIDAAVHVYAPVPAARLKMLVRQMRFAAPQWQNELAGAIGRAQDRLAHSQINGSNWYWPANEPVIGREAEETVRLLAPFDPLVSDRARFESLWGWVYRFEAYTPAPKRLRGYYALPLLWRDQVIGWANLSLKNTELRSDFGYVNSRPPRDRSFQRELELELERVRLFLGLKS